MDIKDVKIKKGRLPETPGVYLMKDAHGGILYVGKAANLRRRVESYFSRPHDMRIERLVGKIRSIDYEETNTAIEALVREAQLIKELEPPFNVREKDDKSFLYVVITREKYPRVLLVRGKDLVAGKKWGPFTSAGSIREALRILRKVFPYNEHEGPLKKPCFNHQIGLCPGVCAGDIDMRAYRRTLSNLKLFLDGKRKQVLRNFEKEMKVASSKLDYEKAGEMQRRVFALQHIQDVALIGNGEVRDPEEHLPGPDIAKRNSTIRIEGYDISNISGTSAVGSMVVFSSKEASSPAHGFGRAGASGGGIRFYSDKNEYRKFRIRAMDGPDDTGMLREVVGRRMNHTEWRMPDLMLIDGGVPQINAVRGVLRGLRRPIPVIGIAKGPQRKRNDIIGIIPPGISRETLIRVRDEAHRFAISYHKKLRSRNFLE